MKIVSGLPHARLGIILIIIISLTISPVFAVTEPGLMDSHGTENADAQFLLKDEHPADQAGKYSALGQSFNADENAKLESVSFVLYKSGSPTWNATAELYAHTGTFGTNGKPTGQPLALSNEFNLTQLNGSTVLYNFQFSYDQQYDLVAGTKYFIVFRNPMGGGVSDTDYPIMLCDATGNHEGNYAYYTLGGWVSTSTADTIFYLYTTDQPYIAQNTDQFSNDVYNWVNVTVRDGAGIANFQTVDIQINTTGDAESFTHRWTQATDAFSTTADPDGATVLDTVRSQTKILDTNTSIICFRFKMSNATAGLCDIKTTGTDDLASDTSYVQLSEFRYSSINWDEEIYELINSLFGDFGITDYMTTITTYLNGFAGWFESSLTRIYELMYQQFRVIDAVYTFFTYWFTAMVGIVLDFSEYYQSILDGTYTITTGLGNIWNLISYDAWAPIVPLAIFLWWIDSLPKRAAQTVGGEVQVFINDISTAINLVSYFTGIFMFVANTIIDRVYGLLGART